MDKCKRLRRRGRRYQSSSCKLHDLKRSSRDLKLHVRTGVFMVPLLKGPVDKELVMEMSAYDD